MRYVVTGAAGFIGSHLSEALLESGHEVLGIDSFTDYYDPALKEENARHISVERLDLVTEPLSFSGFDGVFHLAAHPRASRAFGDAFPLFLSRNIHASQRVFEAAARSRVRVVLASSSSIYGAVDRYPTEEDTIPAPLSAYGVSKLASEQLAWAFARAAALDVVVLRYFTVYGPRQRPDMAFTRIALALAEGRPFELYGDGRQSRSWTYVTDAVQATIAAMARGRGTYNVAGTEERPLLEAISVFESVAGRSLEVRQQPGTADDPPRTSADISRIRSDLGWEPRISLEQGVRAQWDWAAARVASGR